MSVTIPKSSLKKKVDARFTEPVTTEEESVKFMKRLTAIAVSSILYTRGIFDDDAYGIRYHEDKKLRILSERSDSKGASDTVDLLKGAFDALSKEYLKEIVLGIYTNPKKPNEFLEAYNFKYSYEKKNYLNFSYNNKEFCANQDLSLSEAIAKFFERLTKVTYSIAPLPAETYLTMKLFYYDHTPADYEPPGFKSDSAKTYTVGGETMTVTTGHISTKFHTLKLKMVTEKRSISAGEKRQLSPQAKENLKRKPLPLSKAVDKPGRSRLSAR